MYIYNYIYISAFSWYNSTSSLRSWGVFFTAGLFSSPDPCWSLLIPVGCQATFSERVRLVPVHLCLWSSTIKPQVATKIGPKKSHWAISPSYMGMLQHMLCWEKNNSLIYIILGYVMIYDDRCKWRLANSKSTENCSSKGTIPQT